MYVSLSQETALCGVQCGKVLEFQLDICEDGRIRLVRVLFFGAKPNCRRCIVKVRRAECERNNAKFTFRAPVRFPGLLSSDTENRFGPRGLSSSIRWHKALASSGEESLPPFGRTAAIFIVVLERFAYKN